MQNRPRLKAAKGIRQTSVLEFPWGENSCFFPEADHNCTAQKHIPSYLTGIRRRLTATLRNGHPEKKAAPGSGPGCGCNFTHRKYIPAVHAQAVARRKCVCVADLEGSPGSQTRVGSVISLYLFAKRHRTLQGSKANGVILILL